MSDGKGTAPEKAAATSPQERAHQIFEKAVSDIEALGFAVRAGEISIEDLVGDGKRLYSARPGIEIHPLRPKAAQEKE